MIEKPELKNWITSGNFMQIGAMLVALGAAYAAIDNKIASAMQIGNDHEIRIRALEKEIAVELSKISTKLGIIERAVKP